MPSDKTLEVELGGLDATSMRYHELWLQRWLYSRFFVRHGYPVPVVFGMPMDAFSQFNTLWAQENNPFAFLLNVKDDNGTPLYEPHPSPARYPIISVMRQGVAYRPYQNFSIHRWRHVNWPTVSDTGSAVPGVNSIGTGLVKCDLGNITTSRMPMAFDYRFQIDFLSLRPDTQAFFMEKLLRQFWRTGGTLQTWMDIEYPGWGSQYIRIYVDGNIDNVPPDESAVQDRNVEFRTSFTLVIEGFDVDLDYQVLPTLWQFVVGSGSPGQLDGLLLPSSQVIDLREKGSNLVLESRPDIPSAGTCQSERIIQNYLAQGTVYVSVGDPALGTFTPDNVATPNFVPVTPSSDTTTITPQWSYGIPSGEAVGTPTFTGTVLV